MVRKFNSLSRGIIFSALILMIAASVPFSGCLNGGPAAQSGDEVRVHYVLSVDGEVYQSSRDMGQTFDFTLGTGAVIAGFDDAVVGMKVGDKKTVTIPPKEAYGERNPDYVRTVSREELPFYSDSDLVVGQQVYVASEAGYHVGTVTNISGDNVTIDYNPPLAGKTLTFEIELVEIVSGE